MVAGGLVKNCVSVHGLFSRRVTITTTPGSLFQGPPWRGGVRLDRASEEKEKGPEGPFCQYRDGRALLGDDADLLRLGTLGALGHDEGNPLTLGEGLEAGALDVAVVDEGIFAAVDRDEAVALLLVKPFDRTVNHVTLL